MQILQQPLAVICTQKSYDACALSRHCELCKQRSCASYLHTLGSLPTRYFTYLVCYLVLYCTSSFFNQKPALLTSSLVLQLSFSTKPIQPGQSSSVNNLGVRNHYELLILRVLQHNLQALLPNPSTHYCSENIQYRIKHLLIRVRYFTLGLYFHSA